MGELKGKAMLGRSLLLLGEATKVEPHENVDCDKPWLLGFISCGITSLVS